MDQGVLDELLHLVVGADRNGRLDYHEAVMFNVLGNLTGHGSHITEVCRVIGQFGSSYTDEDDIGVL